MHNTNNFYTYRDVLEIYPDETVAVEMVDMLGRVIRYYKNGDEWHRRHLNALSRDEYEYHVTFLKELRDLAENMSMTEETALIIQDEFLQLNLNHWIRFTEKYKLHEIMLTIRAIKGCMVKYLNADSILEYRDCLEIMERWEFAITEMMMR